MLRMKRLKNKQKGENISYKTNLEEGIEKIRFDSQWMHPDRRVAL